MRKRPTGRKLDSPVPSLAVIGASVCSSQSWALDPKAMPAAANPTIPRKTRRPTGVPLAAGSPGSTLSAASASGSATRAICRTYGAAALMDGQLSPIDALWGEFGGDPLGDRCERLGRFAVGICGHDRPAFVAAFAQRRHQGNLADERHLELIGQLLAR